MTGPDEFETAVERLHEKIAARKILAVYTETSPWELRALRGGPEASGPATLLARLPDHYPDSTSGRPVTPALRSLYTPVKRQIRRRLADQRAREHAAKGKWPT